MSTTLANCMIEMSKQMGDYWASTTTSAGAAGGTSVVDTALQAKLNDWITDESHTRITSGTCDGQERYISSLDATNSTLTTLAHSAQIANGVSYEVHRIATASDKRIALISAARDTFPHIHAFAGNSVNISTDYSYYDITNYGFHRNTPHMVEYTTDPGSTNPTWTTLHNWWVDSSNYLRWLPNQSFNGGALRFRGIKTLQFLLSNSESTNWSATIAIDTPQTDILVAQAIINVCKQYLQPNQESSTTDRWKEARDDWENELRKAIRKHRMATPPATVMWG